MSLTGQEIVMLKCAVCLFLGIIFGVISTLILLNTDEKEDTKKE